MLSITELLAIWIRAHYTYTTPSNESFYISIVTKTIRFIKINKNHFIAIKSN